MDFFADYDYYRNSQFKFCAILLVVSVQTLCFDWLQEHLCEILYTAVDESCPGIYLERQPISVEDLKQEVIKPSAYSSSKLFLARLEGKSEV